MSVQDMGSEYFVAVGDNASELHDYWDLAALQNASISEEPPPQMSDMAETLADAREMFFLINTGVSVPSLTECVVWNENVP